MKEISKELFNEINKNGKSTNGEGKPRDFIIGNAFPEGSKTFDDCNTFEEEKEINHQQCDIIRTIYDGKERVIGCRSNYINGWDKTGSKYYEYDNWDEAKRESNTYYNNF